MESSLICSFIPKLGMVQDEGRSQELQPGLPHGWQSPKHWTILSCFTRCLSRELNGKRSIGTRSGVLIGDAGVADPE